MKTLYLIDGYSFLYRAFHIAPPFTNPQGIPIGAVYIYTKMLLKLLRERKPDLAVVAYDNAQPTLRKQIYPQYKANRKRSEELMPQYALARQASRALGFLNVDVGGYEADDIIATLTKRAEDAGHTVVIVSADKDLMQLVTENVTMYDTMHDKVYGPMEVKEKFGVIPSKLAEVLALTGDVADNIPGVPKIGQKTAARLIKQFGSLESLLEQTELVDGNVCRQSLEANKSAALLSLKLIHLYYDVPVYIDFDDTKVLYNKDTFVDFCETHDFKSIISKL